MTLRDSIRRALTRPCSTNILRHFDARPGKVNREVRFVGIGRDADSLGVSRIHLYLVLSGQRRSRRLLSRYTQLKGQRS